ncbi:G-type lectin S-receptor-like serine/threonine-protein kinase At1g11330 isoform X2 [Euphorbia lathyris]|uniref:G-type lectin S-receptor-like serine/threonine-protein kinase At1g11330 isoform X2 n=1 Tax=Euphorbia lathyris TaxID=212925 RepID=UPI003313AFEF
MESWKMLWFGVKLQELPLYTLQKLIIATDNFHTKNKLGQGGFGPVYKGEFPDGQEIAVKRLSRASGQGFEEFMNEVVVISKLQHRNLVRLFGCCVEGEEKMLVYEYKSNKSLDAFLFGLKFIDFGGFLLIGFAAVSC